MRYEHTAVFDHAVDDVFRWHGRPGALSRLVPPWQPVRAAKEADSLRDGEAVLALPAGLEWRARHDPASYVEGRRFVDVLATPVLAPLVGWRHTHSFGEEPGGRCRITDTVDSRVPRRWMGEMFAYRTRQIRGDLAAHERWRAEGDRPLRVAMSGSSGLVGSALEAFLTTGGHTVVRLVRRDPVGSDRLWRPEKPCGRPPRRGRRRCAPGRGVDCWTVHQVSQGGGALQSDWTDAAVGRGGRRCRRECLRECLGDRLLRR